jgi:hypothetical protein
VIRAAPDYCACAGTRVVVNGRTIVLCVGLVIATSGVIVSAYGLEPTDDADPEAGVPPFELFANPGEEYLVLEPNGDGPPAAPR